METGTKEQKVSSQIRRMILKEMKEHSQTVDGAGFFSDMNKRMLKYAKILKETDQGKELVKEWSMLRNVDVTKKEMPILQLVNRYTDITSRLRLLADLDVTQTDMPSSADMLITQDCVQSMSALMIAAKVQHHKKMAASRSEEDSGDPNQAIEDATYEFVNFGQIVSDKFWKTKSIATETGTKDYTAISRCFAKRWCGTGQIDHMRQQIADSDVDLNETGQKQLDSIVSEVHELVNSSSPAPVVGAVRNNTMECEALGLARDVEDTSQLMKAVTVLKRINGLPKINKDKINSFWNIAAAAKGMEFLLKIKFDTGHANEKQENPTYLTMKRAVENTCYLSPGGNYKSLEILSQFKIQKVMKGMFEIYKANDMKPTEEESDTMRAIWREGPSLIGHASIRGQKNLERGNWMDTKLKYLVIGEDGKIKSTEKPSEVQQTFASINIVTVDGVEGFYKFGKFIKVDYEESNA